MKIINHLILFIMLAGVTATSYATDGKTYPGSLCHLTNIESNKVEKVTRPFDGGIYNDSDKFVIVKCPIVHDDLTNDRYRGKALVSFVRVNAIDKNHLNNENILCEIISRVSTSGSKIKARLPKSQDASNDVQHLDMSPYKLWTRDNANLELACTLPKKVSVGGETRRSGIASYRIYEKASR